MVDDASFSKSLRVHEALYFAIRLAVVTDASEERLCSQHNHHHLLLLQMRIAVDMASHCLSISPVMVLLLLVLLDEVHHSHSVVVESRKHGKCATMDPPFVSNENTSKSNFVERDCSLPPQAMPHCYTGWNASYSLRHKGNDANCLDSPRLEGNTHSAPHWIRGSVDDDRDSAERLTHSIAVIEGVLLYSP